MDDNLGLKLAPSFVETTKDLQVTVCCFVCMSATRPALAGIAVLTLEGAIWKMVFAVPALDVAVKHF